MALALKPLVARVALAVTRLAARTPLLAAITPSGGAISVPGIAYGPDGRHKLDVYSPPNADKAPVVVFFYGGSWQTGARQFYRALGHAMAARGIASVVADYRLYPKVRFPAFVEDCASAFAWAHANIAAYGGDPKKLFLMGHSAGAYNAAMIALDPKWLKPCRLDPARDIRGLIGLSGPYDFGRLTEDVMITIFGGDDRADTHPINFVTSAAPPSLLITGGQDIRVDPGNTARFARRVRDEGGFAEEIVYPTIGHLGPALAFVGPLQKRIPIADQVARFIRERVA